MGAICALLVAIVLEYRAAASREHQNQNYGTALAGMAAQQAVDAALNHDLVSLQVILQDVVANPGVVLSTIHDVENNLLVQAGSTSLARAADIELVSHTAPITLHDSVAGYVTVTLTAAGGPSRLVLISILAAMALLALIGGIPLYRDRARLFTFERSETAPADQPEGADTSPTSPDYHPPELPHSPAFARLHAEGLSRLRDQVSAEMFEQTCITYENLLDDVLALYSGQRVNHPDQPGEELIYFESSESQAEAVFRAACSIYLVAQMASHLRPFPLELRAAISLDTDEAEACLAAAQRSGLWIEDRAAQPSLLQDRLVLTEHPELPGIYRMDGFNQRYSALLEKQRQQLSQPRN